MVAKPNKNEVNLNIALSDSIITPKSCSLLVTELVKYIIYQKQLIPYPFEILKYYVSKRKDLDNSENESDSKILNCVVSERYFKKSSDALEIIESFVQSISHEILTSSSQISEVLLLLGSNPNNPQDVFQIVLPSLSLGHLDSHHSTRKPLDSLMKTILINDMLNSILSRSSSSTNLYVILKLKGSSSYDNDDYIQRDYFRIPSKSQHVSFTFQIPSSTENCLCVIPYEDSILSFGDNSMNSTSASKNIPVEKILSTDDSETNYEKPDHSGDQENESSSLSQGITQTKNKMDTFTKQNRSHDVDMNSSSNESDSEECLWYQNRLTLKSFQDVQVKGKSVVNYWVNPSTFL